MELKADQALFEAITSVIGATSCFLTKSILQHFLAIAGITSVDDGSWTNGVFYKLGLPKQKWLYNCFVEEYNARRSTERITKFLEVIFDPVRHTERRNDYEKLVEDINKPLMLHGCCINSEGKLSEIVQAHSLAEVDRRTDEFRAELTKRNIHQRVMHYCRAELLKRDYSLAVLEAAKGLADRVRELTGRGDDGASLFEATFSSKDPYLFLSDLKDECKRSEQNGLRELMNAIFHLIRNPLSHRPKIKWNVNRNEALDVFVLISLAHKYLDECFPNPSKVRRG